MNTSIRAIITLFTLAIFLGACLPATTSTPAPQVKNTQSPLDVKSDIETAVAQTIEAQDQIGTSVAQTQEAQNQTSTSVAKTMQAQATATFTATPFTIPTITPFATSTPGGGGVSSKPNYACDVIHQRPYDNSEFRRGQEFDIKWTIVNTGTQAWPAGYDLKYLNGPHFMSLELVQIPELDPNEKFEVIFDAKAPDETGFYVMTWVVEGQLCYPYIAIIVK